MGGVARVIPADPGLGAVVRASRPLVYRSGADPSLDRPAYVRAGSGMCWVAGRLAVIQDDAAFLVLVDPADAAAECIPLPVEADGIRLWDETRGNKHLKPDLEACVALDDDTLLAFGSGSTSRRERIMVCSGMAREPTVRWHDVATLYALLRAKRQFSGSQMNIEGAALIQGTLRLFNRGNGAPSESGPPVNATCDLDLDALRRYLDHPNEAPPNPERVVQYDLGSLGGASLGFTDAMPGLDAVIFSAAAEASPDTYLDGPVEGSAIGYLRGDSGAWISITRADGKRFRGKVEGIAPAPGHPGRIWAVVDRDDPATPSELCEIELAGDWPL